MNQISVSNIIMKDVQTPIFIRLGDRRRVFSDKISVLKNIRINNVIASSESWLASSITGVLESVVENVSISNMQITSPGGVSKYNCYKKVPENNDGYPENRMFGCILPASFFYVRHAKGIIFSNIQMRTLLTDVRPAFFGENTEDIICDNCFINGKLVMPESIVNK